MIYSLGPNVPTHVWFGWGRKYYLMDCLVVAEYTLSLMVWLGMDGLVGP